MSANLNVYIDAVPEEMDELKQSVNIKQEVLEEDLMLERHCSSWQEGNDSLLESRISPAILEPIVTISDGDLPSTSSQESDDIAREKEAVAEKLRTGEYILLRKDRSRSKVWERFSSVYDAIKQRYVGYVQCLNCTYLLSMKLGSGTTHLSRHVCRADSSRGVAIVSKKIRKEILGNCMKKCTEMCIKDRQSSSIVSGEGFQAFGQELIRIGATFGNVNVMSVLPHASLIAQNVSSIAKNIRQTIMPDIHRAIQAGTCAMEFWTEKSGDTHHIAVTSQYISEDWKVRRQLVFTSQCLDEQDSETLIQEELQTKLAGLGISSDDIKKLTFVTNQPIHKNHSPVLVNHLHCATYSLSSVIKNTFDENAFLKENCPEILKCVQAGKSIIKYLKTNGLSSELDFMSKKCILPQWNSVIVILETVHNNYEYIVQILVERKEIKLTHGWNAQLVSELMPFLLKFKDMMNELQRNIYPTLHLVLVNFYELYDQCLPCSSDHPETIIIKKQSKALLKDIQFAKKHYLATFLCPNTRLLKQLDTEIRRSVHEEVQNLCSEVSEHTNLSLQPQSSKRSRFGAWSQLEEDQGPSFDEIALYLATGRRESEEPIDFLSWWEEKAKTFPRLALVARRILCIPATCSSYEHVLPLSSNGKCSLISNEATDLLLVYDRFAATKEQWPKETEDCPLRMV